MQGYDREGALESDGREAVGIAERVGMNKARGCRTMSVVGTTVGVSCLRWVRRGVPILGCVLVAGCWVLGAGCWVLGAGCELRVRR